MFNSSLWFESIGKGNYDGMFYRNDGKSDEILLKSSVFLSYSVITPTFRLAPADNDDKINFAYLTIFFSSDASDHALSVQKLKKGRN